MNRVIGWVLKKAGLSMLGATGGWFLLVGALTVGLGSGWAGYKVADTIWKAKQTDTLIAFAESIKEIDQSNRARELELIEKSKQRRTIVKEVIKHVPKYVDRDNCALTPAGVQSVSDAARAAFTASKRNGDGTR